jgi:hypothetical protein
MFRSTLPFIVVALCAAAAASAQDFRISLPNASPAEVSEELEKVLGIPVEVRGGARRQVSLDFAAVSPSRMLDRAAAALQGSWRMKLRVKAGRAEQAAPSPELEQMLALGLQDVTGARAFTVIARELKADLEMQGTLDRRVAIVAINVPANVVLDRVAEQAGANWSFSYIIQAPDAPEIVAPVVPVTPTSPVAPDPSRRPATGPRVTPAPAPRPAPAPPVLSGLELRATLREGLDHILRVQPSKRTQAIRDFVADGERLFGLVAGLPPAERKARLQAAQPILSLWRRLYRGLAPEVAKEYAPVTQLLERHLARPR